VSQGFSIIKAPLTTARAP